MEQTPEKDEVLIARNNETGQIGAVVGQNPDGTPQMADVKSTPLSEMVKFNKGQNPLEAFIANFMRQAKNPTTFGIFKMSAEDYDALAEPMAEMLNDPETNKAMLEKYRVEAKTAKVPPIDPEKIDWPAIEKDWGIKREDLEKPGALQQMIYNHKSPQLFTIKNNTDGSGDDMKARLSFRTNDDGTHSSLREGETAARPAFQGLHLHRGRQRGTRKDRQPRQSRGTCRPQDGRITEMPRERR